MARAAKGAGVLAAPNSRRGLGAALDGLLLDRLLGRRDLRRLGPALLGLRAHRSASCHRERANQSDEAHPPTPLLLVSRASSSDVPSRQFSAARCRNWYRGRARRPRRRRLSFSTPWQRRTPSRWRAARHATTFQPAKERPRKCQGALSQRTTRVVVEVLEQAAACAERLRSAGAGIGTRPVTPFGAGVVGAEPGIGEEGQPPPGEIRRRRARA